MHRIRLYLFQLSLHFFQDCLEGRLHSHIDIDSKQSRVLETSVIAKVVFKRISNEKLNFQSSMFRGNESVVVHA